MMASDFYLLDKPITPTSQMSVSFNYSESGQKLNAWQFIHLTSWDTECFLPVQYSSAVEMESLEDRCLRLPSVGKRCIETIEHYYRSDVWLKDPPQYSKPHWRY